MWQGVVSRGCCVEGEWLSGEVLGCRFIFEIQARCVGSIGYKTLRGCRVRFFV